MKTIPKYCHNTQCGYIGVEDADYSYAHYDFDCPACGHVGTLKSVKPEKYIGPKYKTLPYHKNNVLRLKASV